MTFPLFFRIFNFAGVLSKALVWPRFFRTAQSHPDTYWRYDSADFSSSWNVQTGTTYLYFREFNEVQK